jgi:hypothetical protein
MFIRVFVDKASPRDESTRARDDGLLERGRAD